MLSLGVCDVVILLFSDLVWYFGCFVAGCGFVVLMLWEGLDLFCGLVLCLFVT